MKSRLLELLVCPSCKGGLKCEIYEESSEIEEGLLICRRCHRIIESDHREFWF